jgi:hypothetical protein
LPGAPGAEVAAAVAKAESRCGPHAGGEESRLPRAVEIVLVSGVFLDLDDEQERHGNEGSRAGVCRSFGMVLGSCARS